MLLTATLFLSSCDKDDPDVDDPVELITVVNYSLIPDGGGDAIELSFSDPDGDGGDAPTITGGTLAANQTYSGTLELLNPSENISEEVAEEAEEHQFFFQTSVAGLTVSYSDQDADGNPIGLSSTLTTGDAGSGTITITLRHEPDKSASGVSDGNIANAGGETDIEVTIPVDVQ